MGWPSLDRFLWFGNPKLSLLAQNIGSGTFVERISGDQLHLVINTPQFFML